MWHNTNYIFTRKSHKKTWNPSPILVPCSTSKNHIRPWFKWKQIWRNSPFDCLQRQGSTSCKAELPRFSPGAFNRPPFQWDTSNSSINSGHAIVGWMECPASMSATAFSPTTENGWGVMDIYPCERYYKYHNRPVNAEIACSLTMWSLSTYSVPTRIL